MFTQMKTKNIVILGTLLVVGYYLYKVLKPAPIIVAPPKPEPKRDSVLNTPIKATTKYPIGQTPVEETKVLYPDAFKGSVINVTSPDGKISNSGTSGLISYMNNYQSSTYGKLDPRIPNYR
jgi:hypothetical protein